MDRIDAQTRSRIMSSIKGKNTKPEMVVRRGLFARGLRYRLHAKGLPGRPDLVFRQHRAVVFVNGCFWHKHECRLFHWPGSDRETWRVKLEANAERDSRNIAQLQRAGWRVLIVWECSMRGAAEGTVDDMLATAESFIRGAETFREISG